MAALCKERSLPISLSVSLVETTHMLTLMMQAGREGHKAGEQKETRGGGRKAGRHSLAAGDDEA
jgi:hypothetical protein